MRYFFDDVIVPAFVVIAIVAAMLCLIFGIAIAGDAYSCAGFSKATGYETKYKGLACYAKVDGKYVPSKFVFGYAVELRGDAVKVGAK